MKKAFFIVLALLVITLILLFYLKKDEFFVVKSRDNEILAPKKQELEKKSYFEITFLDIGQGDASFIEWPDGKQMLIDCAKDARVLEALGRVMDFYDKEIDYLLVTHPDIDHYGGCTDVLKRFDVRNIVYSGLQEDNKSWEVFWQAVQDEGAEYYEITEIQEWEIDGAFINFLYPDHNLTQNSRVPGFEKENKNDASLVFKFSCGEIDILFTGDAEENLEEYLMSNYSEQLDVEILKVGHHGSGGSSSQGFLDLITPEISTISAGKENNYGHPSRRVIKRLERVGSEVWRTDLQGDINFRIYEDKLEIF